MHYFREIALGLVCFLLVAPFVRAEQLAETEKFEEISGIVALAGYWEGASVEGFTIVDQVGLPPRKPVMKVRGGGYWHILLTDVSGLTADQAKFISVVLGRHPIIHPIYLDYIEEKVQSENKNRPIMYLCFKAPEDKPIKIGTKLSLRLVNLVDTGGMRWELQSNQILTSP